MLSGSRTLAIRAFARPPDRLVDLARREIQHFLAPPADIDMRAMRGEPDRHFLSKPRAPARDQDALTSKQGSVKHG